MQDNEYFKQALSDFSREAAYGAAIRHLADQGLTVRKIAASLSYPVSAARIRKAVARYFMETGIMAADAPQREGYVYCCRDMLETLNFCQREYIEDLLEEVPAFYFLKARLDKMI